MFNSRKVIGKFKRMGGVGCGRESVFMKFIVYCIKFYFFWRGGVGGIN